MQSVCGSKFACLACVLWLLWAAPPLAAQLVAPADEPYFNAYRRGDPITKWPLKKARQQIPQLNGLKPAKPDHTAAGQN